MFIDRYYRDLQNYLKPNKVLVIYGPRQAGKTTLVKRFLNECKLKYRLDSGDDVLVRELFASSDFKRLKEYVEGYELIVIDEAQRIDGIGDGLKILVDQVPGIKVIVTGSASFELAGQIGEPLTGRKSTLTLYPVAQLELLEQYGSYDVKQKLSECLIYGAYPEVVAISGKDDKREILNEIISSYLLKDILALEKIKSPKLLLNLLRLLAFQVGSQVSLSELGRQLAIDNKTVSRYLDLLEKTFIIYPLGGFSRNLRKEIVKKNKYYFYDVGIRNALIANFNDLNLRNDVGALWENFLLLERIKKQSYRKIFANNYFWRTWNQNEIDLVEEREGRLFAFEFKWGEAKVSIPKEWSKAYQDSEFLLVNQDNYMSFIA